MFDQDQMKKMTMIIALVVVLYYVFGLAKNIVYYIILGLIGMTLFQKKKPELVQAARERASQLKATLSEGLNKKISEQIQQTVQDQMQ
tara:strand:+ start:5229 stop:5492 length:264 start_codon:yes stop_codon:yes gene_type:complete